MRLVMGPAGGRLAAVLLAVALLGVTGTAARAQAEDDCPAVVDPATIPPGTMATGLTVMSGTEPVEFDVEILGVLRNAIAPGRDVVVIDAVDPMVEAAGGLWAGMSGSPVFLDDGRLVGAVALGFSAGPSTIGGLTPGADLLELLRLGTTAPAGTPRAAPPAGAGQMAGGLRPLPVPLAVSGLGERGLRRMQEAADRAGLDVVVTGGSARALAPPEVAPPEPGENFAAVLSVGDITQGAIATTTLACEGRVLAVGHPFLGSGATRLGAYTAEALTVAEDPLQGSFKIAQVAAAFGTVDQDRWAGLRADLTGTPEPVSVTSQVTATESGATRNGATGVIRDQDVPFTAAAHLAGNLDSVSDRIGPGSSSLAFTVTGTTADGTPWSLERSNVYVSSDDIGFDTAFTELLAVLAQLLDNGAEDIDFASVDLTASVTPEIVRYTLADALVTVDGGPPIPVSGGTAVFAEPGSTLGITALLDPGDGSAPHTAELVIAIPEGTAGGTLALQGAGSAHQAPDPCMGSAAPCEAAPPPPGPPPPSLEALIAALEGLPRNNEVIALFQPFAADPATPAAPVVARAQVDRVVEGSVPVPLEIEPDAFEVREVAGSDRVRTAAALSADAFAAAETVVVTRADGYADALAGSSLAAQLGGPLLITPPAELRPEVAEEIGRLGASAAVLLGGEDALGPDVAAALEAGGLDVRRIAGPDRFATAALVAAEIGGGAAYLAKGIDADPGQGWADALSVSALAAAQGRPVLLTASNSLPNATRAALEDLGVSDVTIVGGEIAVTPAVAAALPETVSVSRLAGETRYETSIAVAEAAIAAGARLRELTLATGRAFPDALAAGPAVAMDGGVLLLLDGEVPGSPDATYQFASQLLGGFDYVRFVGGPSAITPGVREAVRDLLPVADQPAAMSD